MMFYNRVDELGRFYGLKVYNCGDGQFDTHLYSYLQVRKQLVEAGFSMGLEHKVVEPSSPDSLFID